MTNTTADSTHCHSKHVTHCRIIKSPLRQFSIHKGSPSSSLSEAQGTAEQHHTSSNTSVSVNDAASMPKVNTTEKWHSIVLTKEGEEVD